jgi:transcription-repair coupling factor (superfamily II helicase)
VLQTSTSLALRSILKSAAARSGLDRVAPRLTGVTSAALAFHAAVVAQDAPLFLVVAGDKDVEEITSDARFFLATLEGLSALDAERLVLPFPSQEVDPFRGLLPHLEVASARARALHALATRTARLVIASARALQPRLSNPDRFKGASLSIEPGMEISPQDLGARLATAGFTPEDPVDEHGEF